MTIRIDHLRLAFGRRDALLVAVVAIAALSPLPAALHAGQRSSSSGPERVTVNDNRHPGGSLAGNVLTIRLEARMGQWFPDGDDQPGLTVKAFAVEGGALQIPGGSCAFPKARKYAPSFTTAWTTRWRSTACTHAPAPIPRTQAPW